MAKASQAVILENEFYIIKAPNGKVLEVKNFNTENGAAIQLWSYAGHPWQQWQFVDAGEGVAHQVGVFHHHAFGELEFDLAGVNSVGSRYLVEQGQQSGVEKVGAGEVDCDGDVLQPGFGPLA